jgi:hypothetical protein
MTADATPPGPADERAVAAAAWADLAAALGRMGDQILHPPYPGSARETAEGYRYLGRLAVLGLQWAVEFADPDFPAFYRHDDDITKWGGPNVDNRYLRARVRHGRTYRVTGNASTSHGFVVQVHQGDMQYGEHGVYGEVWNEQLDLSADGTFELVVGGEPRDRNWLPLHVDAGILSIREYFDDWATESPGWFDIACVETEGLAPPPLRPSVVADRLAEARRWAETSLRYWNDYIEASRGARTNHISAPRSVAAGAAGIAYGSGFYTLADDEAMVIEGGAPDAWHWNFLLYNIGWFESLDIANRTTSLNGAQMRVDDDGSFRIVVAHRDPGTPNWLDTSGLESGMITYRYLHARSAPDVTARVVALDDVRSVLPSDTPVVSPRERRAQIAVRQRHIARRFRQ